jgi:hypothetical protein
MSKKKKLYLAMRLEQNPLTTIGTVTCSDEIEGIMFVFSQKGSLCKVWKRCSVGRNCINAKIMHHVDSGASYRTDPFRTTYF